MHGTMTVTTTEDRLAAPADGDRGSTKSTYFYCRQALDLEDEEGAATETTSTLSRSRRPPRMKKDGMATTTDDRSSLLQRPLLLAEAELQNPNRPHPSEFAESSIFNPVLLSPPAALSIAKQSDSSLIHIDHPSFTRRLRKAAIPPPAARKPLPPQFISPFSSASIWSSIDGPSTYGFRPPARRTSPCRVRSPLLSLGTSHGCAGSRVDNHCSALSPLLPAPESRPLLPPGVPDQITTTLPLPPHFRSAAPAAC
ncbi:unnamed protein product [Linum tenue]|uniref:Uncharacterized protein n=1 Tax=Linum tenue TaxID=586396 RepID=A0AAV0R1L3_9ROSI|nr:unnamed protein product [Linum tenue]